MDATRDTDQRARRNVIVLVAAQALLGAQLPMIFVIGGLVGTQITPIACLATLPITCLVLGSMTMATPISALMQSRGRRTGFLLGAAGGAMGAVVAGLGVLFESFLLLCAGSYLSGVYMSAQGFYRFAAADTASETFRPKAISYVLAGGLAAALIGPFLVKQTFDISIIPFLGTYAAVAALNILGAALFFALDIPTPAAPAADAPVTRSRAQLLRSPIVAVSIISAMVAYALMNLVMTSTPLAVVGCGFSTEAAADIVTAHVLAMFAPSFFTGHLIARFGARTIIATGLFCLAAAGVVALSGVELGNFFGALILLGLGWNFGFIGATTMLTAAHAPEEKGRVQGLNDMIVMGGVVVASLASGGLMNCAGTSAVAGWTAVNLAMVPFLTLAGGALIWLTLQERTARGRA